jgi:hypothetical protein
MAVHDSGPSLGYHQDVVEGMMDAREPFNAVEEFINEAAPLSGDQKAALWLLAWSLRSSLVQRREARAMVGATGWWQVSG